MTDTKTPERKENLCIDCGVTLNGYPNLRDVGWYTTHHPSVCINNLRAALAKMEKEKADD